jgi:acyl carrier protein
MTEEDEGRMTDGDVLAKLTEILTRDFRVPREKITPDATFRGNMGLDSLDAVDLIYLLKKTFGLDVNVHAFRDLHAVKDVVAFIANENEAKKT